MSSSTVSYPTERLSRPLPVSDPPGKKSLADAPRANALPLFGAEAANSIAGTLLTVGLPFYSSHRFQWGARENFAVATCQGVLYVLGALSARSIADRWGRKTPLLALYALMALLAIAVGFTSSVGWPLPTVGLVALETGLMGASWPILESLVSAAGAPSRLSQRLGVYNIVWASTGAAALAASGAMIQHAPSWAFFGTIASGHLLAGILIAARTTTTTASDAAPCGVDAPHPTATPLAPTPDVARRHRLALWLSRIALPATYVVVYSLAPALPSLHAIRQLSPTYATLVASIWFIARATTFVITASTTFWHERPAIVLWASVGMLFAFLGTVIPGALTGLGLSAALVAMAASQLVLGLCIGMIYAASLYFGMVVSDGSTEHGGYHEALIGLGQVLGPMAGAATQWIRPGALWPAVGAIAVLVAFTVCIEAWAAMRLASRG